MEFILENTDEISSRISTFRHKVNKKFLKVLTFLSYVHANLLKNLLPISNNLTNFAIMNFLNYISIAIISVAAVSPAKTPTVEESLEAGREAFLKYDFEEAAKHYAAARKKAKKKIPPQLEEQERELMKAENFLERVEQLVILDSIAVPKVEFFKAYKLPFSAGSLGNADAIPFEQTDADYVFTNEGNDFKMWAQPDSTGIFRIVESIRLTDGSWHEPTETPDILNNGGNAIYPFMMSDGVTLYYASDNEESLGGYDIFVATRDAADGEYLQPQNIGMPYNSPYDDYLLAIDELNGVGWWATDRNQLGDNLTVYLFKVNDLRKNYNSEETENIPDLAFIRDYKSTWGEDDYTSLLEEIQAITPGQVKKQVDFIFPMKGGVIYTTLNDFQTSGGKTMMKKYLAAEKAFNQKLSRLSDLRHKFAINKGSSMKAQIRSLESETEKDREALRRLRSEVYRAEQNAR